jgi:GT2 family glycosyltransferase
MRSLRHLFSEHKGKVTDKWAIYIEEYDRLFTPYRQQGITLMEIGVQNGGSLEIWGKYFTRAEKLVGCDIDPACARLRFDDPRITVVTADANTDEGEQAILSRSRRFNLIIDDGSHLSKEVVRAFARYFPHLEDGGLFVAEDMHCSYWKEFSGGLSHPCSAIAFFKRLADVVNYEHWGIGASRAEVLGGFNKTYGASFDEQALAKIHSVEFVNSMCVVRKRVPDKNSIGFRRVAGLSAEVAADLPPDGSPCKAPDQRGNRWAELRASTASEILESGRMMLSLQKRVAAFGRVADERRERIVSLERELGERGARIEVLDRDLAHDRERFEELRRELSVRETIVREYVTSSSWRITAPLRAVAEPLKRMKRFADTLPREISRRGGTWKVLRNAANVIGREGLGTFIRKCRAMPTGPSEKIRDYQEWIRHYDTIDDQERERVRSAIASMGTKPLISVLMPVFDPPIEFLDAAILSVRGQLYPEWELCIADDASRNEQVRALLARHASEDDRIRVVWRKENGHISRASNSALELARGEFVALLDHDDLLAEHALYRVAEEINRCPEAQILYSDEDKIDAKGKRYDPYFKCELNYELLLSQNMISHLGVYRRSLMLEVGGFRTGFEGSQDYDLALRALERVNLSMVRHMPGVLYHWRAASGSTALRSGEKEYAMESARKAVAEHLERSGHKAKVLEAPEAPCFNRVRFALPEPVPLVSIIIPTRDQADLLGACIDSITRLTTYPRYEIVVIDNGSVEVRTQALFEKFTGMKVRVLRHDAEFNFSELNNLGVKVARGSLICLMNNDIEILTADWLEEMASHAVRDGVGCVGARLWYPGGLGLQHGGVILGVGGVAGHAHLNARRGNPGYFGRAVLLQSYSAVTAACLLVRRAIYERVGGLDEKLRVAFNDIDFCLRVAELGYRNVWTPYAEMFHHESASRGYEDTVEKQSRFIREIDIMSWRWGAFLANDPAYNPNLTLERSDFGLAWPPRASGQAG